KGKELRLYLIRCFSLFFQQLYNLFKLVVRYFNVFLVQNFNNISRFFNIYLPIFICVQGIEDPAKFLLWDDLKSMHGLHHLPNIHGSLLINNFFIFFLQIHHDLLHPSNQLADPLLDAGSCFCVFRDQSIFLIFN
uniref:Uncharacterized protein n=1 Tax=Ciona intestinalis TaxID=7719 RepID=H2XL60_CIOIN